jgi:hypothetical protein
MNNAIAHVQAISEAIARMETLQKLIGQSCIDNAVVVTRMEAAQLATRDVTFAALQRIQADVQLSNTTGLRIEDAIEHLRTGTPPNSNGFMEHFAETDPLAKTLEAELQPVGEHKNATGNDTTNDSTRTTDTSNPI